MKNLYKKDFPNFEKKKEWVKKNKNIMILISDLIFFVGSLIYLGNSNGRIFYWANSPWTRNPDDRMFSISNDFTIVLGMIITGFFLRRFIKNI